ncbi:hypothetical protein OV079_51100 [Nannocystis pusilla]|uniref:Tryptophan halogenase n=1 Tax=Nannocystis pusilla TaxID=889268 RepID=A0A9X3J4C8_9BACT|nr:hypothetical protein [Nannocystis pusilla]MCY1013739.1 hypothetical protein [Nannocystis pusilla]
MLLDEGDGPHTVVWSSTRDGTPASARVRWVLDCSGRNRFLAKKMKHAVDMDDGFQTTAAWGQFSGVTDALFGERWVFDDEDGEKSSRDYFTVHMWGEGYWIWVIRLGGDRISIGVTWTSACRRQAPRCERSSGTSCAVTRCWTDSSPRTPCSSFAATATCNT